MDGAFRKTAVVLVVTPNKSDREFLGGLFQELGWALLSASNYRAACEALCRYQIDVVLTERRLPGGMSWRDIWREAAAMSSTPYLIVTDRIADDDLWAEVLNMGAFDVVMQPLERTEVSRVVASALAQSRSAIAANPDASGVLQTSAA